MISLGLYFRCWINSTYDDILIGGESFTSISVFGWKTWNETGKRTILCSYETFYSHLINLNSHNFRSITWEMFYGKEK